MDGTYTEKVNYTKPKLDQYGNPVINFKSMKIRSRSVFRGSRKPAGAKRGRPRTRPERTTPKRPYKRSYLHTKEAKALAKEKEKALREEKRAAKAEAKAAKDAAVIAKMKARGLISMMVIERKRSKGKTYFMPGDYLANGRKSRKPKAVNIAPFSIKIKGAPAPTLPVVSGPFS
jgi:hypothetical protein